MRTQPIERIERLSPESFARNYRRRGRPVIITNEPGVRAAASRWNLDYLVGMHPHHQVSIEHYETGDTRFWSYKDMELAQYVELIRSQPGARSQYYLAEKPLAEALPNIVSDLITPEIVSRTKIEQAAVFLGIDTFTRAHYHSTPMEAVLTQLCGKKRLTLLAPGKLGLLRPYPWYAMRSNWARLSMSTQDGSPATIAATLYECMLEPGEMLFIPQGWFHEARGLGESVSVTYFFRGSWRDAHPRVAARDFGSLLLARALAPLLRRPYTARVVYRLAVALGLVPQSKPDS